MPPFNSTGRHPLKRPPDHSPLWRADGSSWAARLPVHSNTAPEGTGAELRCRCRAHAATFIGFPCQADGRTSFSADQPERNITLPSPMASP